MAIPKKTPPGMQEKKAEDWKKSMNERIRTNQEWLLPIMLALATGWIGFVSTSLSGMKINFWVRGFAIFGVFLLVLSILSVLFHLYLDMKWSKRYLKWELKNPEKINKLSRLMDTGFWLLVWGIVLIFTLYSHVQFG